MQEKKTLKTSTIGLMAAVAIFFDTLQALLTFIMMGWLVPPVAYGTFWLWFKFQGLDFFTLKRAPSMGIGVLLEMVPGLDVLPAITFNVVRAALDTKFKEEISDKITNATLNKHSKAKPMDENRI